MEMAAASPTTRGRRRRRWAAATARRGGRKSGRASHHERHAVQLSTLILAPRVDASSRGIGDTNSGGDSELEYETAQPTSSCTCDIDDGYRRCMKTLEPGSRRFTAARSRRNYTRPWQRCVSEAIRAKGTVWMRPLVTRRTTIEGQRGASQAMRHARPPPTDSGHEPMRMPGPIVLETFAPRKNLPVEGYRRTRAQGVSPAPRTWWSPRRPSTPLPTKALHAEALVCVRGSVGVAEVGGGRERRGGLSWRRGGKTLRGAGGLVFHQGEHQRLHVVAQLLLRKAHLTFRSETRRAAT